MNILLLGNGGREHALAWKLSQSPLCTTLYIAPGNAGTALLGRQVDIEVTDFEALKTFIITEAIEMLVVGPEKPLVDGIEDYFRDQLPELKVVGPSQEGAQMEGSKSYAKSFMKEYGIPTAAYIEVSADNLDEGIAHISLTDGPYVLKADGLAGGKGVLIIADRQEAIDELKNMLDGKFGVASLTVVIEAFLKGIEFSVFVLTDGQSYQILPVAKDYKRIGEGDTGLNTGGMGAISPVTFVDHEMMNKVEERIIRPTIAGLAHRDIRYVGFIFLGLIEVNGEPFVIEYNCRMGDPETQVVIPRLRNDLVSLLLSLYDGSLSKQHIQEDERSAATVVMVSGGYPGSFEKAKPIILADGKGAIVFHSGTTHNDEGELVTNGGRVLALTSYGENHSEAVASSLALAERIDFEGKYFRRDIGFDL